MSNSPGQMQHGMTGKHFGIRRFVTMVTVAVSDLHVALRATSDQFT
ncbi:MAG: hypothetical protein JXR37_29825 [Kiritimatiellae bacterium]|nr:hypothetical protein [Kiritimatiellia bacterium]